MYSVSFDAGTKARSIISNLFTNSSTRSALATNSNWYDFFGESLFRVDSNNFSASQPPTILTSFITTAVSSYTSRIAAC